MYVRKKQNRSGSISVQIIDKNNGKYKVIKTIGSSKDIDEVERMYIQAKDLIPKLQKQSTFNFLSNKDENILEFIKNLGNSDISAIGGELVFGKLFDRIGFNIINNQIFKDLVISRLIYQGSKLKLIDYIRRYENREISVYSIYRFLDKLNNKYKDKVEQIAFEYTKNILKTINVVFYDMTTLYFEAQDEDDFRKIGFSKDGKFQSPQIMLGLLVGEKGYPIGYELFEGNTFEGHTLIPILKKFQDKFNLDKPIIVADSALLSKDNIKNLKEGNYQYIIGARIKNEPENIQNQILNLKLNIDGQFKTVDKDNEDRLIISYSDKRAKKDSYNRKKCLSRLEKRVSSGKLTKDKINNRGYNKYLKLKNEVNVEIDYEKFEKDSAWDGLKGYITNTKLSAQNVIENYSNLWQIEKAFRMSKTDLQIRPIYHRRKKRIEAHISISLQTATEIAKTIYQIKITLPDSKQEEKILLNMTDEQKILLKILNENF